MFEDFGETIYTIEKGRGFGLFGAEHIAWLAAMTAVCAVAGLLYRRCSERQRTVFLHIITWLLLIEEAAKHAVLICCGTWRADYLPFHLCSVNIFVILAYTFSRRDFLAELLYALCLPGAMLAMLFPAWKTLPPTAFLYRHSFAVHIMLILYPILLLCGGFRPSFGRLLKTVPFCLPVLAGIYILNKAWGTNFMFLNGSGSGNPLTFFRDRFGNPGYMVGIPILLTLIWAALYGVPFIFGKLKNKH